tara:strand:+ start:1246 stop:1674 length:429 start_codon:yes stop_codon:yes gene_type:complete
MFSLNKVLFTGLGVMLAISVFRYLGVSAELDEARDSNEQLLSTIQSYKNQVEMLANNLVNAEKQNKRLLKERTLLEQIRAKHLAQLTSIENKLQTTNSQLDALRLSTNETTKNWANDCVPSAVISVFKYANARACNQNSRTN